jgi:hypothetical protein
VLVLCTELQSRLDILFINVMQVLIALGLSWHLYSSWVSIAVNTGVAAAIACQGIRAARGLTSADVPK